MEYEKIKQLMDDMGNSKLTAIAIDFPDGTKISMKKEIKYEVASSEVITREYNGETVKSEITSNGKTEIQNNENTKLANKEADDVTGNIVKSPMVGTFYSKQSPTADAYVEVGTEVKKGDTLCIIEAMKLMNEIESEFDGKVIKILVKDGETVEYGTPLFIIK